MNIRLREAQGNQGCGHALCSWQEEGCGFQHTFRCCRWPLHHPAQPAHNLLSKFAETDSVTLLHHASHTFACWSHPDCRS
jgi:hypothetical protein